MYGRNMSPYKMSSSRGVLIITIKPVGKNIPRGLHISFPYLKIQLTDVMIYHYTSFQNTTLIVASVALTSEVRTTAMIGSRVQRTYGR